jgi:hypothetical protein
VRQREREREKEGKRERERVVFNKHKQQKNTHKSHALITHKPSR